MESYRINKEGLNDNYLLLLVDNNGFIDITTLNINKHFDEESKIIKELCQKSGDNIDGIISFISKILMPKLNELMLPYINNRSGIFRFSYSIELDKAYNTVVVDLYDFINNLKYNRGTILESTEKNTPNFEKKFEILKDYIYRKTTHWFNAFDIEIAYSNAKKEFPNKVRAYSHRIGGFMGFSHKITENLTLQIQTNFGYGSVSYFCSLLIYRGIEIAPLSEWIDYRYSGFSEVIRYTRSFSRIIPIFDKEGFYRDFKVKIENKYWIDAFEFTMNAANLSLSNEKKFVDKYIISECEAMVKGLENIYKENEFHLIEEDEICINRERVERKRVSFKGFELIDFKVEKIIGALDFISKIEEYNSIISTKEYIQRIIEINKKFIPKVYVALEDEENEFKNVCEDYENFLVKIDKIIFDEELAKKIKNGSIIRFCSNDGIYKEINDFLEERKSYKHKIELYERNISKLKGFIRKYNEVVK